MAVIYYVFRIKFGFMLVRRRLLSLSSMRTDFERHFIVCYCQGVVATSNWISTCLFFPSSYKLFAIAWLCIAFGFDFVFWLWASVVSYLQCKQKKSISLSSGSQWIYWYRVLYFGLDFGYPGTANFWRRHWTRINLTVVIGCNVTWAMLCC